MTRKSPAKKSQYQGVYWSTMFEEWYSTFYLKRKRIYCGKFKTEREAAIARDKVAIQHNMPTNILKPKTK